MIREEETRGNMTKDMFCGNCGKKIEEEDQYCPYCGAKSVMADLSQTDASEETVDNEEKVKKEKNKKGIIISIVTVFAVIAAVLIGIGIYNAPARRLAEQLDLGNRYLEEMDFEQAVVAFTKAIEIDPMSMDAYIGAADAYVGLGEPERAKEVLEQGMEKISDVRLEEKLKEIERELDRIKREEEERRRAEEAAQTETEERRKVEAALKPLYEKLEAGEEEEVVVEYVWRENLIEVEGSYSPTGDVENGIVLDMQKTERYDGEEIPCFYYGEKTGGSYETIGKWYVVYGDDNEFGIIEYLIYEGEWKNGMPNGQGTDIRIHESECTTYANHERGANTGKCFDREKTISSYKNGYEDGNVKVIEDIDIFDWLDWWDSFKSESRYQVNNEKIVTGSYEYNYYNDDGSEMGWMKNIEVDGKDAGCIPGPWIKE